MRQRFNNMARHRSLPVATSGIWGAMEGAPLFLLRTLV